MRPLRLHLSTKHHWRKHRVRHQDVFFSCSQWGKRVSGSMQPPREKRLHPASFLRVRSQIVHNVSQCQLKGTWSVYFLSVHERFDPALATNAHSVQWLDPGCCDVARSLWRCGQWFPAAKWTWVLFHPFYFLWPDISQKKAGRRISISSKMG